jgi:hypothetical protein
VAGGHAALTGEAVSKGCRWRRMFYLSKIHALFA